MHDYLLKESCRYSKKKYLSKLVTTYRYRATARYRIASSSFASLQKIRQKKIISIMVNAQCDREMMMVSSLLNSSLKACLSEDKGSASGQEYDREIVVVVG